jgi:hypothetical protein
VLAVAAARLVATGRDARPIALRHRSAWSRCGGRVSEQDVAPYYLVHRFGPEDKPQFRKEPFLTEHWLFRLAMVAILCSRWCFATALMPNSKDSSAESRQSSL